MTSVAIIVLNWKTPQLTIDTVNSLLKIDHSKFSFHIFIIDNNSPDDSIIQFKHIFGNSKNISIHDTKSNLGYADGNNFGIDLSLKNNYDYTLIINSDVIVKPDFLEVMVNFLDKNHEYGLVGPKIYFAKGHEFHKNRYSKNDLGNVIWSVGGQVDWQNIYGSNMGIDEVDHGQYDKINSNIDYISGCCQLIRNNILHKFGSFDSKYFMYSEDADFCQRLIRNNIKIAYLPKSIIWHINSGSSGRGPLHDYFLTRNRLLFGYRFASFRTKVALFKDSLKLVLFSPYIWQKIGIKDYYLGKFGKGSWK